MTYEELLKSSDWVQNTSASYFESLGAKVLVFKLDKEDTKLNPIYNEEIDGRKYLRPFEIKSIYKTNPFEFKFDNTLPYETDGSLMFYFNFNSMVKTMEKLKNATSEIKITTGNSDWSISKSNNKIYLINYKYSDDPIAFDLNTYATISELSRALSETNIFICDTAGDDYSTCIPNFKETKISNSILLKTFNSEFKNAGNTIEQGDLIYIPTINALYEVTSAYPVNNTIYRYVNWQCNAQRTFTYVEYEKLKTYQYGFGLDDSISTISRDVSIKTDDSSEYTVATDAQIQAIIDSYNYKEH